MQLHSDLSYESFKFALGLMLWTMSGTQKGAMTPAVPGHGVCTACNGGNLRLQDCQNVCGRSGLAVEMNAASTREFGGGVLLEL